MMKDNIQKTSWSKYLEDEWSKPYMQKLEDFLETEVAQGKNILPLKHLWFEALNHRPLDEIKVLILGQDPYPTVGHAHGLCFSVEVEGVKPPKSLQNINKELLDDLGIDNSHSGYLESWAKQGVLLLNAVLTVEAGNANAHKDKGWETFTDKIVELVNDKCDNVVFVLWGAYAQKKGKFIDRKKHLVLNDPHPSPLSAYRGFWGSKPFSKTNAYLLKHGKEPVDWKLERKRDTLF